MFLIIWLCVLLAVIWLFLRRKLSRFSDYGVPHAGPLYSFVGMLKVVMRKAHFITGMEESYRMFPNDRFVGRYEFLEPIIIIRDLELIKLVAIKDFEYFHDHRGFIDEAIEPLAARNLFLLKGDDWKDMRSTLSPAFTSSKIKLMVPFMEEVGDQMIKALKKKLSESESGYIDIDCKDLTARYGNDVIASCAFGLKVDSHADENNEFLKMGRIASAFKVWHMLMFFILSSCPSVARRLKLTLFSKEVTKFFKDIVLNTMKDREERNIVRPDMIHLLMEAKKGKLSHDDKSGNADQDAGFATVTEYSVGKKTSKKGSRKVILPAWSDTDLVAQAVIFFMAGYESISTSTSFALHELALNPDVQERLYQEIKQEDRRNGGKIDFTSIQNMTYMDMVVSEVLRVWPPAMALDRICSNEYNLGKPRENATQDYIVRKGEVVCIPVRSIHFDPQYFPNPKKFDPERFSEENKHNINPMTYMPFGAGPRNCIGSRFALCELKVLLYQILLHIEVSPSKKTKLPSALSNVSFNPKLEGGHWLRFKMRD